MPIRRQQILDAMITRFQAILVSGGYRTNAGSHCSTWYHDPNTTYDESELPFINLRDMEDNMQPVSVNDRRMHTMDIEIHTAANGANNDSETRKQIYDIYQAIGVDPTWGALAMDTFLVKDSISVEHAEKIIAEAVVTVQVRYFTTLWGDS